jgi:general stress protein 26
MSEASDANKIIEYMKEHPVAVLSTVDGHGNPHGAVVYMYAASVLNFYFVTKAETQKFRDLVKHRHVSVTIADDENNSSIQANGTAHVVEETEVIQMVMAHMAKVYARSSDWLAPITKIRAGEYQVVNIKPSHIRLSEYMGKHPGSTHIFTEITL